MNPEDEKNSQDNKPEIQENTICVKVLGIGSRAAKYVASENSWPTQVQRIAIDTDQDIISKINTNSAKKLLIGKDLTHGLRARNKNIGEQAARASNLELRELLAGTDLLFIVTATGGYTGSGSAIAIAELAAELGIMTFCFAISPFSWEGREILEQAEDTAKRLRTNVDAFISIDNDLFSQSASDLPMGEIFTWVKRGIDTCCSFLFANNEGGITSLSNFRNIFPVSGAPTLFALGAGEGENAVDDAIKKLFYCPLLNSKTSALEADTLIVYIRSGNEPTTAVINDIVNRIKGRFGGKGRTQTSYTVIAELGEKLEICILGAGELVKTKKLKSKISLTTDSAPGNLFQETSSSLEELDLEENPTQGELFLGLERGMFREVQTKLYEGQDLDIPTYIRQQIDLKKALEKKKKEMKI